MLGGMYVTDMGILCCVLGYKRLGRIRNEYNRGKVTMTPKEKMVKSYLR